MTEYSYDNDDAHDEEPRTAKDVCRRAAFFADKLSDDGINLQPVKSAKKAIASTFWGQAWNKNISKYSLFANQLAPGRAYLRNGAVIDLKTAKGVISAMVADTSLYDVEIKVQPVSVTQWARLIDACTGDVSTVADLLAGKINSDVIARIIDEESGLFPGIDEISFSCTCPDWTDVCQHVAAALYGFSVRLDQSPGLFFELRGVDPVDFLAVTSNAVMTQASNNCGDYKADELDELESIFGIDIKR